jgi:hypothetical protein
VIRLLCPAPLDLVELVGKALTTAGTAMSTARKVGTLFSQQTSRRNRRVRVPVWYPRHRGERMTAPVADRPGREIPMSKEDPRNGASGLEPATSCVRSSVIGMSSALRDLAGRLSSTRQWPRAWRRWNCESSRQTAGDAVSLLAAERPRLGSRRRTSMARSANATRRPVAVSVRDQSGKLAAARIYDDGRSAARITRTSAYYGIA